MLHILLCSVNINCIVKTINFYNAGNALAAADNHNNQRFSTPDRDNDPSHDHCATRYNSGWWYDWCFGALLTGGYNSVWGGWGFLWMQDIGELREAIMMTRRAGQP